jgi:hypothetical protein
MLELGVPDAAFAAALLRAVSGPGLASLSICVREAADSASLAALTAAPGAAQQLAGLDLEFRAAPTAEDVAALAACSSLKRLHVSCKCPRAPAGAQLWGYCRRGGGLGVCRLDAVSWMGYGVNKTLNTACMLSMPAPWKPLLLNSSL